MSGWDISIYLRPLVLKEHRQSDANNDYGYDDHSDYNEHDDHADHDYDDCGIVNRDPNSIANLVF